MQIPEEGENLEGSLRGGGSLQRLIDELEDQ